VRVEKNSHSSWSNFFFFLKEKAFQKHVINGSLIGLMSSPLLFIRNGTNPACESIWAWWI